MSPIVHDEYHSIAFTWCHRAWLVLQFSSYFSPYALITMVIYSGRVTLMGKRRRPVIEIASDDPLKLT